MTVSSVAVIPRADLGIVISSHPESGDCYFKFPYLMDSHVEVIT